MRQRMGAQVAVALSTIQFRVLVTKYLAQLSTRRILVGFAPRLGDETDSRSSGSEVGPKSWLGAGGGTRTRTRFPAMDFESISAANFDTPAPPEL